MAGAGTSEKVSGGATLYLQVIAAIVLGVLVGYFFPATGEALKPVGDAFIKLVKMIIAPVIFLTIVTGIAGMRDLGAIGRVAARAFAYFLFFSTLALIIGMVVANVVRPGDGLDIDPATLDASKVSRLCRQGARHDADRLPARHHSRYLRLGADRGQHPPDSGRVDPVRDRAGIGRRQGNARSSTRSTSCRR